MPVGGMSMTSKTIYRDWKNRLWIGTASEGLYGAKTTAGRGFASRTASRATRCVAWCSTAAAPCGWRRSVRRGRYLDGKFTTFREHDGLANDRVAAVYEDDAGALWFTTRRASVRYADGKFTTFTERDGLFADYVSNMLDDGAGFVLVRQ